MKIVYQDIKFDSELEVDYYKYLQEHSISFVYHPKIPIQITDKDTYTPDFVVYTSNDGILTCEIIETKGYNQFSALRDKIVHTLMKSKSEEELKQWLKLNGLNNDCKVVYRKIKYLKQFGWVDFDFKNPNTLSNKRKHKINELEQELKELRTFKKDTLKYFKLAHTAKHLTKNQVKFINEYISNLEGELNNGTK